MPDPKKTTLLVEDNPDLAQSITFALATYGWHVVGPFASAADALEGMTEADAYDVAILDYDLGDDTSVAIAQRLRREGKPFLFMSGYDTIDELPEEFQSETCLPKPVELVRLNAELEALLQNAPVQEG